MMVTNEPRRMIGLHVLFTESQLAWLREQARRTKRSVGFVLRELVDKEAKRNEGECSE